LTNILCKRFSGEEIKLSKDLGGINVRWGPVTGSAGGGQITADTAHAPGMIGTVAFTPQTADKVSNVLGRGILGKPAGRPQQ